MALRTGGRILVDNLIGHGVELAFCVPGESFLGAIEAFREVENRVKLIVCRQEGGAANMAEAYGKLTGRPGVCFVTRAPGVTNASIGLHTARQDSTPMLLLIGQVGRAELGREAFQEVDFRRMLGELTKWVDQVDDPARIPEYVARAYAVAMSGRRGPVALVFPEDVLTALAETTDIAPTLDCRAGACAGADGQARGASCGGGATACDRRRERLVGSSVRRSRLLRRGVRAAGRRRVPLPGPHEQHARALCRRAWHDRLAGAWQARPRRRSDRCHRHAAR